MVFSSLSWPAAQELQRKLAEEQVAAAMGQAPPVTSVSAGAAALGLTMGAAMQAPGAGTRTPTAPAQPVRPSAESNPNSDRCCCCSRRSTVLCQNRMDSFLSGEGC